MESLGKGGRRKRVPWRCHRQAATCPSQHLLQTQHSRASEGLIIPTNSCREKAQPAVVATGLQRHRVDRTHHGSKSASNSPRWLVRLNTSTANTGCVHQTLERFLSMSSFEGCAHPYMLSCSSLCAWAPDPVPHSVRQQHTPRHNIKTVLLKPVRRGHSGSTASAARRHQ